MIINLRQIKVFLVAGLMTTVTGVFFCSILCDLDINAFRYEGSRSRLCHIAVVGNTHSNTLPSVIDDYHTGGELASCCEDLTEPVMASLFYQKISPQKLGFKFVLLYAVGDTSFRLLTQIRSSQDKLQYFDLPPPLKGFDIRISIQSFLN